MVVDVNFEIGDTVYLQTDIEQLKRLVTGFHIRKYDVLYSLSCGINESSHYDFEISREVNVLITTTN